MKPGIIKRIENSITHPNMEEREMLFQIKSLIYESEIQNIKSRESTSIAKLFSENVKDLKNGIPNDRVIHSGFKDLDKVIGGFSYGEFCIIGSRPGVGKTPYTYILKLRFIRQLLIP